MMMSETVVHLSRLAFASDSKQYGSGDLSEGQEVCVVFSSSRWIVYRIEYMYLWEPLLHELPVMGILGLFCT